MPNALIVLEAGADELADEAEPPEVVDVGVDVPVGADEVPPIGGAEVVVLEEAVAGDVPRDPVVAVAVVPVPAAVLVEAEPGACAPRVQVFSTKRCSDG